MTETYQIGGRIIDAASGHGIPGLDVEIWDEDIVEDDYITVVTTDEMGRFISTFVPGRFLEYEPDARPELYFKIYRGDKLLKTTKESAVLEIAADAPTVRVELEIERPAEPPAISEDWVGTDNQAYMPEWPDRALPSIAERARWFQERAGTQSDSGSFQRLRTAMRSAAEIPTRDQLQANVITEGRRRLLAHDYPRAAEDRPAVLVDADDTLREVKVTHETEPAGISSFGPRITVDAIDGDSALLAVPLDPSTVTDLDLETAALVHYTENGSQVIDESRFSRQDNLLYARITEGGEYRAAALPTHPWFRKTISTFRSYWPWLRADQAMDLDTGFRDRICRVILCQNQLMSVERRGEFIAADRQFRDQQGRAEFGIGRPPEVPDRMGFGGDVCEFCLGGNGGGGGGIIDRGRFDRDDGYIEIPPEIDLDRRDEEGCHEWESIGPAPGSGFWGIGRVTQLSVHPTDKSTLLAGAAGGGVWESTDAGVHWESLMEGQPTLTIGGVAYAPSDASVIYAASGEDAGGYNPAWPGIGVYQSTDGGTSWDVHSNVASTRFSAVAVDPTDPDTVYVAGDDGLHKSTDGGSTWVSNPGENSLFDGQITDVVVAHDDADRVYMGVRNDGVYRSTTGGEQTGGSPAFTRLDDADQLPSGVAASWIKLAIGRNGTNGSDFLATKLGSQGSRIFTTTDAGDNWSEQQANVATVDFDEWASVIAVDPENEDRLFAGADGEFERSTDGGSSWTSVNSGVHPDQQDAVVAPTDAEPDQLYLANDGGVYRSTDAGDNWTFASGELAITQFYDIDISQTDPDVVVGGAQDNGVFIRGTGGSWTDPSFGWDGTQAEVDPSDPDIVYFSSQNGVSNRGSGGLSRTTDGGATVSSLGTSGLSGTSPWVTIMAVEPTSISNPASNRTLFVCGNRTLFRSTDGGSTWSQVTDSSGNAFTTTGTITALRYAQNDPSVLYLGTSAGAVYRATSGGVSASDWSRIDTVGSAAASMFPNSRLSSISIDPNDDDRVWVTFAGNGVSASRRPDDVTNPLGISHVFKTPDAGANWSDASGGFAPLNLPDVPTSAVAIDNFDSDVAWVGTDVGVFKTTDGGTTWLDFQAGLPRSPVTELRLQYSSRRLTAATMGRGVYQRRVA